METVELNLANLDRHIQSSFDAITLLYQNEHYPQARYCAFILIDQLAWLASKPSENQSTYFKSWVDKYFIKYYPELNAEEILASRNGLLHRSSSISQSIERGYVDRQLYFTDNLKHFEKIEHGKNIKNAKFFIINTSRFLKIALLEAVSDFRRDTQSILNNNPEEFKHKLGEILQTVPLM